MGIYKSRINQKSEMYILAPRVLPDGRFIFHQSVHERIKNKNVLLVVASMSTGATALGVMDCLEYYGCRLVGISAVFSAVEDINGRKIHALFTKDDIPNYRFFIPSECEMCKEGRNIDAVFNSEGYTKL